MPFSPLDDNGLPDGVGGVYLGGGFPELYAADLAASEPMLCAIRDAAARAVPTYAECVVPVHRVSDLSSEGPHVERELALVKVTGRGNKRVESLRIADIFRARVVDSSHYHFVFEMTGKSEKLDVFIDLMKPLGLVDVSRTGVVAISRGPKGL